MSGNFQILQGDNRKTLQNLADESIDSIVTDPPYGINFLNKDWDADTGTLETYQECLRVLKPGGYILAFSAARTYHHLAVILEQAGFEIRDQLMWLYSSGFPKAQDMGKALDKRNIKNTKQGWKTALKPAHEPVALARKPFFTSCVENVLTHGVGALNIDATRIESETLTYPADGMSRLAFSESEPDKWQGISVENTKGRFPSNVIGEVEADYQKHFYCPKVSRTERMAFNNHPTVKPVELMKYLIKLVTPQGGTVLDPFCGSGSTGMAAVELGYEFIGCELDANYKTIAETRIRAWKTQQEPSSVFQSLFEEGD